MFELQGFAVSPCGIGRVKPKEEDPEGLEGNKGMVDGVIGMNGREGKGGNLGRGGNPGSENAGVIGCGKDGIGGSVGDKGLGTKFGFGNSGANEGNSVTKCSFVSLFSSKNKRLANENWMLLGSSARPRMIS